jgi:Fe2+ transport system protein B
LLHPVWGYVILFSVLFLFFQAVYGIGKLTEPPLLALFDALTRGVLTPFGVETLLSEIVLGIMQGIAAGVAIVLPFLLPFLFGLGLLMISVIFRVALLMTHSCIASGCTAKQLFRILVMDVTCRGHVHSPLASCDCYSHGIGLLSVRGGWR